MDFNGHAGIELRAQAGHQIAQSKRPRCPADDGLAPGRQAVLRGAPGEDRQVHHHRRQVGTGVLHQPELAGQRHRAGVTRLQQRGQHVGVAGNVKAGRVQVGARQRLDQGDRRVERALALGLDAVASRAAAAHVCGVARECRRRYPHRYRQALQAGLRARQVERIDIAAVGVAVDIDRAFVEALHAAQGQLVAAQAPLYCAVGLIGGRGKGQQALAACHFF